MVVSSEESVEGAHVGLNTCGGAKQDTIALVPHSKANKGNAFARPPNWSPVVRARRRCAGMSAEGFRVFFGNVSSLLGPDRPATPSPACLPRPHPPSPEDAGRSCSSVCFPYLPNRSSLNPLHSVKNRAPAAIQVCLTSLSF